MKAMILAPAAYQRPAPAVRNRFLKRFPLPLAPLLAGWLWAPNASAAVVQSPVLWQERYYFDALLQARGRQEREESDPEMVPVLQAIAGQVAQQGLNLKRLGLYVAAQKGNVRFAFAQKNPDPSLKVILSNLMTLARGTGQIRNNLDYLAVRCRLASSQALSDPKMEKASLIILAEIRQLQLELNFVYLDSVAVQKAGWMLSRPKDKYLRSSVWMLVESMRRMQNSVYSVYDAARDLALRCR